MNVEKIRRQYKPQRIKLLLVGESPPKSGKFFYLRDSAMVHHTKKSFYQVFGWDFKDDRRFLLRIKKAGVFLDSLPAGSSQDPSVCLLTT